MRPPLALLLLALAACDPKTATPVAVVPALPSFSPAAGGRMVQVAGSFFIDVDPVTQELYQKVMGVNPSKQKQPQAPVAGVQWVDAVRFCNKCSERDGLKACYDVKTWDCDLSADGYRLPTEAEWEQACRAGGTGKYPFGDDAAQLGRFAWTKANSEGKIHPVGQKEPNAWGLHDMLGNVWQWTNDWADAEKRQRVLRGGAWDTDPAKVEVSLRKKEFPVYTDACFGVDSNGFRRVKNATLPKAGSAEVAPPASPSAPEAKPSPPASTPAAAGKTIPGLKGTIVFVSDRSGALEIWRMHASGRDQKPLTKEGTPHADPKFSPDGKSILYTALKGGFPEVWLMGRDGSGAKKVAAGSQAAWSPDGKSIVLIRENQTYVRELESGKEQRLTPEQWERCGVPAWSPDGKTIAVASRHLESIGIFLVGVDGKPQAQLKAQEACCTPAWSKDGKRLLCQTVKGHIHQLDADGKNWEQVTFGADVQHDARYSPDESMLVYCRAPSPEGPWQICVKKFDSDDFDFAQITTEGSNSLPDWTAVED
ncbi:MAG: SUMF1/EgtB/PvdO family nonheme iron enzyme [Planctomycetaceae bacterium]|nr:SUMF1/EgtB/PvdO family nonheme iron enzyme [Planctomycetaceae bacterium]